MNGFVYFTNVVLLSIPKKEIQELKAKNKNKK